MIKHIKSSEEFYELIKKGRYLVDFYATWCGPCKMIAPTLEEISSSIDVLKIDTDEVPELAEKYGIMSIPTLIYFKDGKETTKSVGYVTKEEIQDLIK